MQLAQTVQAFQHVILWKMSHLAEAAKLREFIVVFHWTPKPRASQADTARVTTLSCGVICHPDQHKPLGGCWAIFFGKKKAKYESLRPKQWEQCGARGNRGMLRPWGQTAAQQGTWFANPTSTGMHPKAAPKRTTFPLGREPAESVGLLRNAKLQICLSIPRIRTAYWVFNYCTYLLWTVALLRVTKMQFHWNFSLNTLPISSVQRCLKAHEDQNITFIFSFSVLNRQ